MKLYAAKVQEYDPLQFLANGKKYYTKTLYIYSLEPIENMQMTQGELDALLEKIIKDVDKYSSSIAFAMSTIHFVDPVDPYLYDVTSLPPLEFTGKFWEN